MRDPKANVLAALVQPTGTEPVVYIVIDWGSGDRWYSTRKTNQPAKAIITRIGAVTTEKRQDSYGTCGSVSVTLSDYDGSLKQVIDFVQIEKCPAAIYLSFAEFSLADAMLLLRGRIIGPVTWAEGNREVSFEIETIVEDNEIGTSITKTEYPEMCTEAEGVTWPMIFGTCAHVPTLRIRRRAEGTLQFDLHLSKDPIYTTKHFNRGNINYNYFPFLSNPTTISLQTENTIYINNADRFPQDTDIKIEIEGVRFKGKFKNGTNQFIVTQANLPIEENLPFIANTANDERVAYIAARDDGTYPNLLGCYIQINDDRWDNFVDGQEGGKLHLQWIPINPATERVVKLGPGYKIFRAWKILPCGCYPILKGLRNRYLIRIAGLAADFIHAEWKNSLELLQKRKESWWMAQADAPVKLIETESPEIYIASSVQLSEITGVYGKKKVKTNFGKEKEIFAPLPTHLYTKHLTGYKFNEEPQISASVLVFPRMLSEFGWEENVYVTGTSTVGPNPVNIIAWILQTFTNLRLDATSFTSAIASVASRPAHFATFEKRNAIQFAQEIAFQCLCGLLVDSEKVTIRYLYAEPSITGIYEEGTVEQDSLVTQFTSTNEITTRIIGTFRETYSEINRLNTVYDSAPIHLQTIVQSMIPGESRKEAETQYVIFDNNVDIYGLKVRDETFYIYDNRETVEEIISFWGLRFSNSWKFVKFKAFLAGALLQVYGGVRFSFADTSLLRHYNLTGQVISTSFNFEDLSTEIIVWLPLIAGSNHVIDGVWE